MRMLIIAVFAVAACCAKAKPAQVWKINKLGEFKVGHKYAVTCTHDTWLSFDGKFLGKDGHKLEANHKQIFVAHKDSEIQAASDSQDDVCKIEQLD